MPTIHPGVFQLNATPRPNLGPKHDSLHMAQGLKYCWCMCPKCFLKYGDGNGGICSCRECPCAGSYEATKPMYVPYHHDDQGGQ